LISLNNAILAAANLQTTDLSYSVGDTIFEGGAPAPFVYVASKGALVRFRPLPGGRRSILQFLFAGDGFGYEPDGYHRATVQALTDAEVVAAGRKSFVAASKSNAEALFRAATRAYVIAEEQAAYVRRTATERTALFLLEMHTRLSADNRILLPMTRRDIADYLGLTVETVSRAMNEFRRAKIIEICDRETGRLIIIRTKARLERLASLASDGSKFEWWKR
jgi:CRP/FNR family nitrogen fixation transcriptional regulator